MELEGYFKPKIEIDLAKVRDVLKADGPPLVIDNERIYYHHKHITEYLVDAVSKLRDPKKGGDINSRIIVFIDDLDRCTQEKALEVLESLKTFFDIEGFVYVIGMDSKTINSIVRKKYGEDSGIEGFDYMQKIVQSPFQIPTWKEGWKEEDIAKSIIKIILKGLEGSEIIDEFRNNKQLIVKAVHLNPREVKRFINNIILAKAVNDKPVDQLIVVQAFNRRDDWNRLSELISTDTKRRRFFNEYKKLKEEGKSITNKEELYDYYKGLLNLSNKPYYPWFEEILDIHEELIKQRNNDLKNFLDAGADKILLRIEKMEELRRALDTAKLKPTEGKQDYDNKNLKPIDNKQDDEKTKELLKLLREGKIEQFNELRAQFNLSRLDFSYVNLESADLRHVNLSNTDLFHTNLSFAYFKDANLEGANLALTNLSAANLQNANLDSAILAAADLSYANFSYTILRHSIMIGCKGVLKLECENADFTDAIIDNIELH